MKILQTNRLVFCWMSAFPPEDGATKWKKLVYGIVISSILVNLLFMISTSSAFFLNYVSTDLGHASFGIVEVVTASVGFYMVFVSFLRQRKLFTIYKQLAKICNAHKNRETARYLTEANEKCEKIWDIFFIICKWGSVNMILLCAFSVIISKRLTGQYVSQYSFTAYKTSLPWDVTTLYGYIGRELYELGIGWTYMFCNSFVIFFMSICLYHRAFYRMMQHSLSQLDRFTDQNKEVILNQFVRFHVTAIELFEESAEAFSPIIVVQMFSLVFILAGCVFQADLQIKHPNFDAPFIILEIFICATQMFVFCYFGMIATDSYQEIATDLYNSNWYLLPNKLQKHLLIINANARQPLYYHGLGIVDLNLETYTKFSKAVYTYYMMFKTNIN